MSSLSRRPGGPPNRRKRADRAYQLAVTGGIAGAVAVIGGILAMIGVIGGTIPVIALIVAIVCVLLFRRTVGP